MRTRKAQEGLGYWRGDTELSDGFTKFWGRCMFVGKRKIPRRAVDLEGPGQDVQEVEGKS